MNPRDDKPIAGPPSVEVIVVAFNSGESLVACLAALPAAGKGLALTVTVIDNCSSEFIAPGIGNCSICVEVVRSPRNLGYGGGNNLGIRRALQRSRPPDAILVLN